MGSKRFDIFIERHIGISFRWDTRFEWPLWLSFSVICITVTVGIGKKKGGE